MQNWVDDSMIVSLVSFQILFAVSSSYFLNERSLLACCFCVPFGYLDEEGGNSTQLDAGEGEGEGGIELSAN